MSITAAEIQQAWLEVFPESSAWTRSVLDSTCVSMRLAKDASECANRILSNDPLNYTCWIRGDDVKEDRVYILTVPPKGSNLVYKTEKMRRKTVKNATYEKMVQRFQQVRDFLANQELAHDYAASKIGC